MCELYMFYYISMQYHCQHYVSAQSDVHKEKKLTCIILYDILSEKVFDQINKSPDFILKDLKPRDYIINGWNFIIKIEVET